MAKKIHPCAALLILSLLPSCRKEAGIEKNVAEESSIQSEDRTETEKIPEEMAGFVEENPQKSGGFTLPVLNSVSEIDLSKAKVSPEREKWGKSSKSPGSVHDLSSLYIVGFSPDGKSAWLRIDERDGTGEREFGFFIQDLVSDEVLWDFSSPAEGKIEDFLRGNAKLFDSELERFSVRVAEAVVEDFPYTNADIKLDAKIEIRKSGRFLNESVEFSDYSLVVQNASGNEKTVLERKGLPVEEAFVCGFVKNPFEERIAVIVAEAAFGFEGCDLLYSVAGCDTKKGF